MTARPFDIRPFDLRPFDIRPPQARSTDARQTDVRQTDARSTGFRGARAAGLALGLLLAPALAGPARAHAVLERGEASPGATYRGVVQIMHGCAGKPTTRVSVTIPEGMVGAKPMPKPGWTLATARGAYARAYETRHGSASEGVTAITWSGGELPDDEVDEFTFLVQVSDAFAPGTTAYFPVQQDCAEGGHSWSEIPAAGQDPHALRAAAPAVRIVQAAQKDAVQRDAARAGAPSPARPDTASGPREATVEAGDLTIETPWLRATPNGAKVAGGYVTVTNRGTEPDRLVGAAVPFAGRAEIHSMSMEGGVMRMAPVEGGLAIAPGGTLTLKPGGYHLMFEDLKSGPKAGETIPGTLTFERAGPVPVTFTVAPIGASGPGASGPGMGGMHHH